MAKWAREYGIPLLIVFPLTTVFFILASYVASRGLTGSSDIGLPFPVKHFDGGAPMIDPSTGALLQPLGHNNHFIPWGIGLDLGVYFVVSIGIVKIYRRFRKS